MRLKGKVALVTGSGRGIGREIALRFAREGAGVVVNYRRSEERAREVVKEAEEAGVRAVALQADVSRRAEVKALFKEIDRRFARIDIVVNNAGILEQKPFEEITDENWDEMFAVCLKGPFIVSQEVFPYFKRRQAGRIINIASMGGQFGGPKAPHYAAAKAGLICFTRSTARIMAGCGVTVNAVSPGFVETEMSAREIALSGGKEEAAKNIPAGRIGRPEDIAAAAVYLATDEAAFVTGHILNVNGGQYML